MEKLPYEISYLNPQNGVYIELFFPLFPEESGVYGYLNNEFSNVFDTCISEKVQNVDIGTLEPTLHLLYLMCRAFKHFIPGVFGNRTMERKHSANVTLAMAERREERNDSIVKGITFPEYRIHEKGLSLAGKISNLTSDCLVTSNFKLLIKFGKEIRYLQ